MKHKVDVLVIGGGHAGVEAACAAARMGAETVIMTLRRSDLGVMSCNPAIGGLGRGHIVREIDALDGIMGKAIDRAGIHFRMLNRKKGPAVRGPRAQADRRRYQHAVQELVEGQSNLTVHEGEAAEIRFKNEGVDGVVDDRGHFWSVNAVVLTTGTFLRGLIHCGQRSWPAGRHGSKAVNRLSESLRTCGFRLGRLKTGTPPRLLRASIDWAEVERQEGDPDPEAFSYLTDMQPQNEIECGITYTTAKTHGIIRQDLERSPVYSGLIQSGGVRYCPSIEDKIAKFPQRERHHIFLEPEGTRDDTVYPNGISTALPEEIQRELVHSIPGLTRAIITQPGYAIEYDHIDACELNPSMERKKNRGLFLAGQINGTTGYEEAAGQGLVAGVNAAKRSLGIEADFIIPRTLGYIGVMISDITTRPIHEPYRMFTSRAEFRLSLRADNADMRLTPVGIKHGVVGNERTQKFNKKMKDRKRAIEMLRDKKIHQHEIESQAITIRGDGSRRTAYEWLAHQGVDASVILPFIPELRNYSAKLMNSIETDCKYAPYLERHRTEIARYEREHTMEIPVELDYPRISGLRSEIVQILAANRPKTLADASRLPGMTPGALSMLHRYVRRC